MCKQEIIFKQLTSQTLQKIIYFKSKIFVKKPALYKYVHQNFLICDKSRKIQKKYTKKNVFNKICSKSEQTSSFILKNKYKVDVLLAVQKINDV